MILIDPTVRKLQQPRRLWLDQIGVAIAAAALIFLIIWSFLA